MSRLRNVLRLATVTIAATLVAACASTPSQPKQPKGADLSGEWVLTTESQMGAQDALMTVRQTGKALAGTISGQGGNVDYTGSVNGRRGRIRLHHQRERHGLEARLQRHRGRRHDERQGRVRPVRRRHVHGQAEVTCSRPSFDNRSSRGGVHCGTNDRATRLIGDGDFRRSPARPRGRNAGRRAPARPSQSPAKARE